MTNNDTVGWSTIKVYPTLSDEPLTTEAELAEAAASDPDSFVGDRIVDGTDNATIATLAPGETASFSFSVSRGLLGTRSVVRTGHALEPGVYWFGLQALGQGPDGRVDGADGRARTFLPLVPQRAAGSQPVSIVVPLRRPISYAGDGSLTDVQGWQESLSDGGRLRSLVDLGSSSRTGAISWLVDPALVDAVRHLAAGNPSRSLVPDRKTGQGPDPDVSTDPAAEPTSDPSGDPTPAGTDASLAESGSGTDPPLTRGQLTRADPITREVALAAQDWLSRFSDAVRAGDELLSLPYGDTDVSAASATAPGTYQAARARSAASTILEGHAGVQVAPAVSSPSGFLNPAALDLIEAGATVLLTDQMFSDPPATTVASTDGHNVVVTSTGAASGGPGPDDPQATTAMRQRLLAEAAVHFLDDGAQPLVAVLPPAWNPTDTAGFFTGLGAGWLDLATVTNVASTADASAVDDASLRYPDSQRTAELAAANFESAAKLIAAGNALQSLLTLNTRIAGTVSGEALTSTSYSARSHPDTHRVATEESRSWIDTRMRQVTVSAPTAVTLSSSTGRFNTTITNGLDQPVTVALDARTDGRLQVTGPRRVVVPAGGARTVGLGASTDVTGVHQVTLRVTDQRGVALGAVTQLSIRSAQVSGIIWLFLAIGALLLFGTIAVRLFRRVRDARRGLPHGPGRRGGPDHPVSASPRRPASQVRAVPAPEPGGR